MPPDAAEVGLTNLGYPPAGMSFLEALVSLRPQRKYRIDYGLKSDRLTICNTLRHMRRTVDRLPDGPEKTEICEYIDAAADFAKRMDARLKELKGQRC